MLREKTGAGFKRGCVDRVVDRVVDSVSAVWVCFEKDLKFLAIELLVAVLIPISEVRFGALPKSPLDEVDFAVGGEVFRVFSATNDNDGFFCSGISDDAVARVQLLAVIRHEQQLEGRVVALELLDEESRFVVDVPRQMAVRVKFFEDAAARLQRRRRRREM